MAKKKEWITTKTQKQCLLDEKSKGYAEWLMKYHKRSFSNLVIWLIRQEYRHAQTGD